LTYFLAITDTHMMPFDILRFGSQGYLQLPAVKDELGGCGGVQIVEVVAVVLKLEGN
jgi:hypothetical protein